MRRRDKEILDRTQLDNILNKAEICRIAMCQNNNPYIVPMNYGYQDGYLYFHSAHEGKKIDILKNNPIVCFQVDTMIQIQPNEKACNWSVKYLSVIGQGRITFIEGEKDKVRALDIIMEKYAGEQKFTYPESVLKGVTVFKLQIDEMKGKKSGY